jgi:hypothetical protein
LTITEPPVGDFGLGNAGGNRDIAAAWFYRLATERASGPLPQQNRGYAQARPQPGLIVVSTMTLASRSAKLGVADHAVNDD